MPNGPVGSFRAGKGSRMSINSTILKMATWNTDYHGDDLPTDNFEAAGANQGTIGIIYVDWDFSGLYDAGQIPFTDPPGVYPRDNLANVIFYENVSDNVFWSIPVNRVLSAKNGADVKGLVTFSATGKSNGAGVAVP